MKVYLIPVVVGFCDHLGPVGKDLSSFGVSLAGGRVLKNDIAYFRAFLGIFLKTKYGFGNKKQSFL